MQRVSTLPQAIESKFQIGNVTTISTGHFFHDLFTAFVSTLLPEIIKILQISLTQAGMLTAIMQIPSLLNPLIGWWDDKHNLQMAMILAPGITASLISSMGWASNYTSLAFLLFLAGLSIAVFHATAPGRLARISGNNIGRGMSFFMGGGEFGRSLGPLVAVWAFSIFSLKGILPLALIGWLSSLLLWLRFGNMERFHSSRPTHISAGLPQSWRFFVPATLIVFLRGLIITSLGTYLPTFLSQDGANIWAAGSALALYQFAGAIGALAGGTLSDHLGRRRVLALTMFASSILLLGFLATSSWLSLIILLLIGVMNLTFQPIMLALVQDHYPHHRSVANGIYMTLSFISFSADAVLVGAIGDWIGLQNAFLLTSLVSLLAIPLLMALPKPQTD